MIRGLYTSGLGMLQQSKKMDVVSNNLANANTTAYKADGVTFEAFSDVLAKRINDTKTPGGTNDVGHMNLSSDVSKIYTNYTAGNEMKTDNKSDLAIGNSEKSFFTVDFQTSNGVEEKYTRDGGFMINNEGYLTTKEGYMVKGEKGYIKMPSKDFSVAEDGTISINNQVIDKLVIKTFGNPDALRKLGNNLVQVEGDAKEEDFKGIVMQGFLEGSNVNVVKEMVDMISLTRTYEANQKVLQTQDQMLEKSVNEIGSLR